jgi:6-phosphogluconolactonase
VNKSRQDKPHAHNVILSPDQNFLYVTDLGSDKIYQHKVYADGTVDEKYNAISITAGNGPRHLIFNPKGTNAYLISEMKGVVDVFRVKENQFEKIQTVVADTTTLKIDRGSADIHLSPSGSILERRERFTALPCRLMEH